MTPRVVGAVANGSAWFHLPDGGARLQLWPQQAAFEPELGLLLVADAQLGQAVSFCRLGVPVPEAITGESLSRLDALLVVTGVLPAVGPFTGRHALPPAAGVRRFVVAGPAVRELPTAAAPVSR